MLNFEKIHSHIYSKLFSYFTRFIFFFILFIFCLIISDFCLLPSFSLFSSTFYFFLVSDIFILIFLLIYVQKVINFKNNTNFKYWKCWQLVLDIVNFIFLLLLNFGSSILISYFAKSYILNINLSTLSTIDIFNYSTLIVILFIIDISFIVINIFATRSFQKYYINPTPYYSKIINRMDFYLWNQVNKKNSIKKINEFDKYEDIVKIFFEFYIDSKSGETSMQNESYGYIKYSKRVLHRFFYLWKNMCKPLISLLSTTTIGGIIAFIVWTIKYSSNLNIFFLVTTTIFFLLLILYSSYMLHIIFNNNFDFINNRNEKKITKNFDNIFIKFLWFTDLDYNAIINFISIIKDIFLFLYQKNLKINNKEDFLLEVSVEHETQTKDKMVLHKYLIIFTLPNNSKVMQVYVQKQNRENFEHFYDVIF